MKKNVFYFVVILFFVESTFGQFRMPKKEDWVRASQLPLVVELKEKNTKIIEKLTKKGDNEELKLYNSLIDDYNSYIKKYVEMYWDKSLIHDYLTETEFKAFEKDKKNKSKFTFISSKYNNNSSKAHQKAQVNGGVFADNANFTNNIQISFGILGEKFPMTDNALIAFFFASLDKGFFKKEVKHAFKESDLKFCVNYFKTTITNSLNSESDSEIEKMSNKDKVKLMNINAKELKKLTLLVDEKLVSDSFLKEFKDKYKYKYEIVNEERIDEAILNNEEGYAYFHNHFQPSMTGQNYNLLHVYETKNLTMLYFTYPKGQGGVKLGILTVRPGSNINDVDEFIEAIEMN